MEAAAAAAAAAAAGFCRSTLHCSSHLLSHRAAGRFGGGAPLNLISMSWQQEVMLMCLHSSRRWGECGKVFFIHGHDFGMVQRKGSSHGSRPYAQNTSSEYVWCHVMPSLHLLFWRRLSPVSVQVVVCSCHVQLWCKAGARKCYQSKIRFIFWWLPNQVIK